MSRGFHRGVMFTGERTRCILLKQLCGPIWSTSTARYYGKYASAINNAMKSKQDGNVSVTCV
jgi:hypothetical protein